MAIVIPPELSVRFHAERRRARLRRILLWSPVIFVVAAVATAGFVVWRGHGLLHVLSKWRPSFVGRDFVGVFWLTVVAAVGGVLGLVFLVTITLRGDGLIELPYCTHCSVPDETNQGRCAKCGATLEGSCEVLYPDLLDDAKVLRAFGLRGEDRSD